MNPQERIEQLKAEIRANENQISNCVHDFMLPEYETETVREPLGYKTVGQGSDVWTEATGYRDVKKARWSRTCNKCGKKEYTYTSEPVIKEYKPKF